MVAATRRNLAILTASHAVQDLYGGSVPAILVFFVAQRHFSYLQATGLILAATVSSSLLQPLFGLVVDARDQDWISPVGLTTAAIGIGLCGLFQSYPLTWLAIAVSGIGTAAYHPGAARLARIVTSGGTRGMSVFSTGGNVGFTLGPLVCAPLILAFGLGATPFLAIPGVVMAVTMLVALRPVAAERGGPRPAVRARVRGGDDWGGFTRVTIAVVTRSAVFFGVAAFAPLYWRHDLRASTNLSEVALACFLGAGVIGALLGGTVADRFGRWRIVRLGNLALIPALLLLQGSRGLGPVASLVPLVLVGITLQMPHSVLVVLGQDYLPDRSGTAAGVTLGLAMTAGGLVSPLLGVVADHFGPAVVLLLLVVTPAVALAFILRCRDPRPLALPSQEPAAPVKLAVEVT